MQPPLYHNIWDTVTNPGLLVSAGANTGSLSAVTFSNSNGVSFGLNAGVITASMSGGTGAAGSLTVSDSATSLAVSQLAFTNSNGLTLTLSTAPGAATLIGSYTVPTITNSSWTVSDSATSATVGQLAFTATNGITLALSTSNNGKHTVFGSYTVPTVTNSSWTVSDSATSVTVGRLMFSNANNVSFGLITSNNGSQSVTASIATTYAGTGVTTATTTGTNIVATLNTSGLSMGVPAYVTAASGAGGVAISNSQTLFSSGTVALSEGGGAITIASSAGGQSLMFSVPQTSSLVGTSGVSISTSGSTISIYQSGINGVGVSNTGNTAGNVGYLTNSNYALAGSGSITLSQSTAAGAATCWIQHPAWITTATQSSWTVSDSATSATVGRLAFVNSNGVSFGLSTSNNGLQSVSASIATTYAGTGFTSATTAGVAIVGTLNTSGLSLGVPAMLTTAALSSAHMSYFENMPILDAASTTLSAGISALQVVPFVVPRNISIGFLRVPISMSYVSTEVSGTTVNTTWTYNRSYTDAAAIFTQLAGANSLSLGYLTSSSCSWVFQVVGGAGAQGSRYTITQNVTYPLSGTTSNYTTSYAQSSANVQVSSASMTLFTGPRWLDIPLGVSLSGGNYWLALGRSTNSATTGGNNSAINGASAGMSYIGVSQNNQTICFPGAVTASSCQLQPGLGSWSTNSAVLSTSSLQLASISAMSSGAKPYFQMIRYA